MRFPPRALPVRPVLRQTGFTVIELMVTIALAAILAAVAIPGMRSMITASQVSSLGSEFVLGATHARAEAIARNRCVTMCITADPNADTPVCTDTTTDWNSGWIIFANPKCDNAADDASAELLKQYIGAPTGPSLKPASGNYRSVRFDSRGMTSTVTATQLLLTPPGETATKMVCIDASGRTRMANSASTICSDSAN